MDINFAAASTAGLNNPGTEIITLVKDGSGNFINPPSYDKMRAYLRSGEVPMLFVTTEGGETGSLYQLVEYSETENKIRFGNDVKAIEFVAGAAAPVVSDVGGGGSGAEYTPLIKLPSPEVSVKEFSDALDEMHSNGALILWGGVLIFYGAVFGKKIYFYEGNAQQYSVSSTDVGDDLSQCFLNFADIKEEIPAALYIESEHGKQFEITIDDSGTISATEVTY